MAAIKLNIAGGAGNYTVFITNNTLTPSWYPFDNITGLLIGAPVPFITQGVTLYNPTWNNAITTISDLPYAYDFGVRVCNTPDVNDACCTTMMPIRLNKTCETPSPLTSPQNLFIGNTGGLPLYVQWTNPQYAGSPLYGVPGATWACMLVQYKRSVLGQEYWIDSGGTIDTDSGFFYVPYDTTIPPLDFQAVFLHMLTPCEYYDIRVTAICSACRSSCGAKGITWEWSGGVGTPTPTVGNAGPAIYNNYNCV